MHNFLIAKTIKDDEIDEKRKKAIQKLEHGASLGWDYIIEVEEFDNFENKHYTVFKRMRSCGTWRPHDHEEK